MPKKEVKHEFEILNFPQVIKKIKKKYDHQGCWNQGISFKEFLTTSMALIRNKLDAGERFEDIDISGYELENKKKVEPPQKKTQNDEPIYTSLYINEEKKMIAEQIYNGEESKFCVYTSNSEETITYSDEIDMGNIYKPHSGEEIRKKAILLPTKAEEYESDEKLDQEIKDYIKEWLDIPEDVLQFAIWNIKRSWVYERFHTLNYLRALGDTGQGKSRFLDVLGYIHYKPIATSGASTAAPVFRIIDKWHGTLIMDEADFQKSDEAQDIIKIINQGYEKGKYVMRCDKDNNNRVNFFEPYGPKILATRRTFYDKAVESRCITQVMIGTQRKDIKWNLNDKFWKQTQTIRNKLLMWRFRNYFKIDPDKNIELDLGELEPRVQQIVASFISLFGDNQKQLQQFKDFIKDYQEELIEERRDSFAGIVVGGIFKLLEQGKIEINTSDIINEQQITNNKGNLVKPRGLTSTLRTLGFEKAKSKRIEGKIKRCIPLNPKHLEHLFKRYSYDVTVVTVVGGIRKIKEETIQEELGGIPIHRNNSNSVTQIKEIIDNLQKEYDIIPIGKVVQEANKAQISEEKVDEAIEHLKTKEVFIFEPRSGFLKKL